MCTYIQSSLQSALNIYLQTVYLQCTYIQSTLPCTYRYLGLGDTLHLQTDNIYFTGELYQLTFCATLTAFDYCILDGSCDVL